MSLEFNSPMIHNSKELPVLLCIATGFFERLVGLLSTSGLKDSQGMAIIPCSDVHTLGMKYALDIIFLDIDSKVIKLVRLPPYRFSFCRNAVSVFELSDGSIERLALKLGDQLSFYRNATQGQVML